MNAGLMAISHSQDTLSAIKDTAVSDELTHGTWINLSHSVDHYLCGSVIFTLWHYSTQMHTILTIIKKEYFSNAQKCVSTHILNDIMYPYWLQKENLADIDSLSLCNWSLTIWRCNFSVYWGSCYSVLFCFVCSKNMDILQNLSIAMIIHILHIYSNTQELFGNAKFI